MTKFILMFALLALSSTIGGCTEDPNRTATVVSATGGGGNVTVSATFTGPPNSSATAGCHILGLNKMKTKETVAINFDAAGNADATFNFHFGEVGDTVEVGVGVTTAKVSTDTAKIKP